MKLDESKIDIFDRYLLGDLSGDDLIHFEDQLRNDGEFNRQFKDYQFSVHAVKLSAIKNEIGNIVNTHEAKFKIFQKRIWIPMAASILLFLTFYFWPESNFIDETDLAKSYFKPYPDVVTLRSASNELTKAMQAYSIGDYKKAIREFKDMASTSDTTLFYYGLSYLSINEPDSAKVRFVKMNPSSAFHQQVNWYMSIASLLKRDRQSALTYLKKIELKEFNYKEARQVLQSLEKKK
jgi:hypothetical protein